MDVHEAILTHRGGGQDQMMWGVWVLKYKVTLYNILEHYAYNNLHYSIVKSQLDRLWFQSLMHLSITPPRNSQR